MLNYFFNSKEDTQGMKRSTISLKKIFRTTSSRNNSLDLASTTFPCGYFLLSLINEITNCIENILEWKKIFIASIIQPRILFIYFTQQRCQFWHVHDLIEYYFRYRKHLSPLIQGNSRHTSIENVLFWSQSPLFNQKRQNIKRILNRLSTSWNFTNIFTRITLVQIRYNL